MVIEKEGRHIFLHVCEHKCHQVPVGVTPFFSPGSGGDIGIFHQVPVGYLVLLLKGVDKDSQIPKLLRL